jgi:hypothetical protein
VADDDLAKLLGHADVIEQLTRHLETTTAVPVRLTGQAGSGKSYIARQVAKAWRANGGRCVVAVGDDAHSWRQLYPLLSGLARKHRDWISVATTGTRSAVGVADTVAGTAGVGTTIFDLIAGTIHQPIEHVLRPYDRRERDVILDLRRIARRHPVLLIADNTHWWDANSLRLLADICSAELREQINQLRSVSVLLIDTEEEQQVVSPKAFDSLVSSCPTRTVKISRCNRDKFAGVLAGFGLSQALPEDVETELFDVTGGHLKLAEQIVAYIQDAASDATSPKIDDRYLSHLISERLASVGKSSPAVSDVLMSAALLGLSCAEQDLSCLVDLARPNLRAVIRRAEDIGFVERVGEQISFSHEVIRSTILELHSETEVEARYSKLARCLSILRPGDYDARARASLSAGDMDAAREMVALAGVAQIRRGVDVSQVIQSMPAQLSDDAEMRVYLEAIAIGYEAVAAGRFTAATPKLQTPISRETQLMAAERNYVAAICALGRQTRSGAKSIAVTLASWAQVVEREVELGVRFLVLLQQAQVFYEGFEDARATETDIEQRLTDRTSYDIDAATTVHIQNRRAASIMVPEIAEHRIGAAVNYFRRGTGEPSRDALELYRSLTNLSAIEIRLDKNGQAYKHAREAEQLAIGSLETGHRLDVLANNLVLAGLRTNAISLPDAIDHQSLLSDDTKFTEDNFLQRCNLAAYQLLASRDDEAATELASLKARVDDSGIDESYLVYYWSALSVAAAALRGDLSEAMSIHSGMERFVANLRWPCASYVRRRHEVLARMIPTLTGATSRTAMDRLLLDGQPAQIGPAWPYYGRFIPCCELSFWSDS